MLKVTYFAEMIFVFLSFFLSSLNCDWIIKCDLKHIFCSLFASRLHLFRGIWMSKLEKWEKLFEKKTFTFLFRHAIGLFNRDGTTTPIWFVSIWWTFSVYTPFWTEWYQIYFEFYFWRKKWNFWLFGLFGWGDEKWIRS